MTIDLDGAIRFADKLHAENPYGLALATGTVAETIIRDAVAELRARRAADLTAEEREAALQARVWAAEDPLGSKPGRVARLATEEKEALADARSLVLSSPHIGPSSQRCLGILAVLDRLLADGQQLKAGEK